MNMMTFIRLTVILSITFIIFSCSQHDDIIEFPEDLPLYSIDPHLSELVSMDDILDDVAFIPLSLPNDIQLAVIQTMIFNDDRIYALEMTTSGSNPRVFAFDSMGNFEYVIDRFGRGPGEYEYIYAIAVSDNYLILSTTTHIIFNHLSDGTYSHSIQNRFDDNWVQWIHFFDDTVGVTSAGRGRANRSMNHVKFFDTETQTFTQEEVPFPSHAVMFNASHRHLFETPEGLKVRPLNSNIVYSITQDSENFIVEPDYGLDFGDLWVPESFLRTSFRNMDEIFTEGIHEVYIYDADIFETEDILYVSYRFEKERRGYMFDKTTDSTKFITDFTDNSIGFPLLPMTTHNNHIVGLVYPFDLEEEPIHPELLEAINQNEDGGHPIIIKAKFKID